MIVVMTVHIACERRSIGLTLGRWIGQFSMQSTDYRSSRSSRFSSLDY
jgi:hypothetical protein